MTALPDTLERKEHLDLGRPDLETWLRRVGLLLFLGLVAAGLANVFGQRPTETTVETDAAALTLRAPSRMRSGLVYQVRFRIEARRELRQPALVLDPGWFDGFTINTVQPEALEWAQRGGRNILTFGRVSAGGELVVRLQYQINPTTLGRRTQNVVLEDEEQPLLQLTHDAVVFP